MSEPFIPIHVINDMQREKEFALWKTDESRKVLSRKEAS